MKAPPDALRTLSVEWLLLPLSAPREGGTAEESAAASELEAAAESIGREYAATRLGASERGDDIVAAGDIDVSAAANDTCRASAVGDFSVAGLCGVLVLKGFSGEDRGASISAFADGVTLSYMSSSAFTRKLLRFLGVAIATSCGKSVTEAL